MAAVVPHRGGLVGGVVCAGHGPVLGEAAATPSGTDEDPVSARPAFDDVALAVLVAMQQRGPLSAEELARLLASAEPLASTLERLLERGHVQRQRGRWAISYQGRQFLDQVLEEIEGQLAPDSPAYVRRYRRNEPSLPFRRTRRGPKRSASTCVSSRTPCGRWCRRSLSSTCTAGRPSSRSPLRV